MKNLYLMAALLLCSIGIAQNTTAKKTTSNPVRFGFKTGVNIAKLTDSDTENVNTTSRIGMNIGVYLNCKFMDKLAFQPELLYTSQGLVQKVRYYGTDFKTTYKLDYIAIPLMIKYYPTEKVNFEFGPQLAFNVNKKIQSKANGEKYQYDLDEFFRSNNLRSKTNTFDFGLNFGLGLELAKGLDLNARYSLGLTKVFEGSDVVKDNGSPENIKNSVFSFGLGYTFN